MGRGRGCCCLLMRGKRLIALLLHLNAPLVALPGKVFLHRTLAGKLHLAQLTLILGTRFAPQPLLVELAG